MSTVYKIGPHHMEFFDDYYLWVPQGEITEDHANQYVDYAIKHFNNKTNFSICDCRKLENISPQARKIFADNRIPPSEGMALWGASFQIRVISNLLINALNLLKKQKTLNAFFKTEEEAITWINERRNTVKSQNKYQY
jgi:hypothetical protein